MADIYGQLVAAQAENLTSDPTAIAGRVYFKSDTGVLKYYDSVGTTWRTVANTDTALTNVMATTGDMIYGGASGVPTKLATGATTGLLHGGNGAVPTWSLLVNADVSASAAIDGSKIVSATAAVAGVVTTSTQTFAGAKTFTGYVHMTGQPAVFATRSSQTVVNTTSDESNVVVFSTSEVYDTTGSYNTTTGLFTAPVAGKYLVSVYWSPVFSTNPASNHNSTGAVFKNGSTYGLAHLVDDPGNATSRRKASMTVLVDCAASDTIGFYAGTNIGMGGSTRTLNVENAVLSIAKIL